MMISKFIAMVSERKDLSVKSDKWDIPREKLLDSILTPNLNLIHIFI